MLTVRKENTHKMTSERHAHRFRMASPDIESHPRGGLSALCVCVRGGRERIAVHKINQYGLQRCSHINNIRARYEFEPTFFVYKLT
jgi:hypothetical protein